MNRDDTGNKRILNSDVVGVGKKNSEYILIPDNYKEIINYIIRTDETLDIQFNWKTVSHLGSNQFLSVLKNLSYLLGINSVISPTKFNLQPQSSQNLTNPKITNQLNSDLLKKLVPLKSFNTMISQETKIAIFMDQNSNYYTGGRYSIYQQAILLADYCHVTLVTDRTVPFQNDFESYSGFKKLVNIVDPSFCLKERRNSFDVVLGVPHASGVAAYEYSKKWNLPLIIYMFESPNFVKLYHDGPDSTEEYWKSFKIAAEAADLRISPSNLSKKYLMEWLRDDDPVSYKVVYPCINTNVANDVLTNGNSPYPEYSDDIVMCKRLSDFAKPFDILKILDKRMKCVVHFIGKVRNDDIRVLNKYDGVNTKVKVIVHGVVNDLEKYKILSSCKTLIHPSQFEGFGIPPMEALYMGKQVVCYDLPVLREVYGNDLHYAELGNPEDFVNVLEKVHKDKIERKGSVPLFSNPFICLDSVLSALSNKRRAKIVVGILAFNCFDYLPYVIKNVYDLVDNIIIVEGAVKGNEKYSKNGHSNDGTYDWLINSDGLQDPCGKIIVIIKSGVWLDKIEMQNSIAEKVDKLGGNIYIKIDADEFWHRDELQKVIDYMIDNPNVEMIKMPFIHLWTNFHTKAVDAGGKWSTKHPRVWKWQKGMRHLRSFNYFVKNRKYDNRPVTEQYVVTTIWEGKPIYHTGYARKLDYVNQKLSYYKNRGIEKVVKEKIYENWKQHSDSTQPTQIVRSWAEDIDIFSIPDILKLHPYYNQSDIRDVK